MGESEQCAFSINIKNFALQVQVKICFFHVKMVYPFSVSANLMTWWSQARFESTTRIIHSTVNTITICSCSQFYSDCQVRSQCGACQMVHVTLIIICCSFSFYYACLGPTPLKGSSKELIKISKVLCSVVTKMFL